MTQRVLSILSMVLAVGCSTPEAVTRLEGESLASIQEYQRGAEVAVAGLVDAYRARSLDHLESEVRLALEEEAKTVLVASPGEPRVVWDPEVVAAAGEALRASEEGEPFDLLEALQGAAEIEATGPPPEPRRVLDPAVVDEALTLYRSRLDAIGSEVSRFDEAWREAGRNYTDAMHLRARLRDYLRRGGIEAEEIEAFTEGLAREIESR
jgi:hypothetical protein